MVGRGYRCTLGASALLLGCVLIVSACATTDQAITPPPEASTPPDVALEPATPAAAAPAPATETTDRPPAASDPTAADGDAALAQSLAARSWQLVLSSVHTPEAAEQESARLLSKGLEVVVESAEAKGRQVYRLTFGAFETREEAQRALDDQRHRPGFERAWVLLRQ